MERVTLVALMVLGWLGSSCFAILHEHLTFDPPFLDVDHWGKRTVGFEWDLSGATKTMKNFVRLTPDLQSKTGGLWSVDAIGSTVFASVLEFRISGKGDRFFGDGLAFWVVEPERRHSLNDMDLEYGHYYDEDDWGGGWGENIKDLRADLPSGDFHGFADKFKGLGVIVDTYRNEEFYSSHKDVTVVINTGNQTREEMVTASVGCNAQVRYYENRDDFEAGTQTSRLKVEINGNILTVKVDAKNTKEWKECAEVTLPDEMGTNWTAEAHVGLTASTGQLSDNHDVVRLETFVSSDAALKGEENRESKTAVAIQPDLPFLERMTQMEVTLNTVHEKVDLMEIHQEHSIQKVEEFVRELFAKAAANEQGLETSMEALESKVRELEGRLTRQVDSMLEDRLRQAAAIARGWRLPFMLLLLVVSGGVFGCFKTYQRLRKSHFF